MNREIWQVLPWLANATLNDEERARAEAALQDSAELRSHLEWELMLRETIKAEGAECLPPAGALDAVLRRINQPARPAQRSGFKDFLARLFAPGQWSPQFAVVCTLAVVQFGVIGTLWHQVRGESDYAAVRSVQAGTSATPFIRVMFSSDIRESELRETLTSIGAEIVAGPSQIGDYYLLVDAGRIPTELSTLRASRNIVAAEIVNALPDKP